MAHNINADSPICLDISTNFKSISHMLDCQHRHFFKPELVPNAPKFVENSLCNVEILNVLSPISFEVRIHHLKDSQGNLFAWNPAKSFDQFNKELNEFHAKSFTPVPNISNADRNALYVLRKGDKFTRCKILDIM